MQFVDLSQDPPAKVTVLTLREVATKVFGSSYYSNIQVIENWVANKKIQTPEPKYTIDEVQYWTPEQVTDWTAVKDKLEEVEQIERAKSLEAATVTKMELVEKLIEQAEDVLRLNVRAYSHNRGNSMADGRLRTVRLQGQIELVDQLIHPQTMPSELRAKLNTLFTQAKAEVKMQ
jgi:hypothetical protein